VSFQRRVVRKQSDRSRVSNGSAAPVRDREMLAFGRADLLRALADALAQRLGKARIVENADAARVQEAGHPAGVTRPGQRAGDDDAVVTRAGERAAVVLSLIESAKLNGHDPWAYLKDVFERLPTLKQRDLAQLLPHNWRPSGNADAVDSAPVTAVA
jgi:hypothetical protein